MEHGNSQIARVERVFNEWARGGRADGMERRHGPFARRAFDWLEVGAGDRYLDVGCGNGYSVRWAAAVDPSVRALGLDVAGEMIALAEQMSADHPNAAFVRDRFPSERLADASFDAIFSMEALYYLPDLDAALAAVRRLLAPGGRFACVVDFFEEHEASHSWPDDLGVAMKRLSAAGWGEAIARAGLELAHQERLENSLITCATLPA